MAYFLIQASYTPGAWAAQIKNPQDRLNAVAEMLAPTGVKFVQAFYAFGEYDLVIIAEAENNVDAAAGVLAAVSGGALSNIKTTVLMTSEDGVAAIRKAGEVNYSPPG